MASSARIDELQKKFNENPRRYFAPLADEFRKAGDLATAIEICRAHLAQQPGHMSGHIVLGKALYEAGEYAEARQVFETALGLDPENLIALRHLGDIARQQGDVQGARGWYQRVLDADPRNEEISAQLRALDEEAAQAAPAPADAGAGGMEWGQVNPEPIDASQIPTLEMPAAVVPDAPTYDQVPDTLAEDTTPDGNLPPALEPSAIAYLAEEAPVTEAAAAPARADEPLDLDAADFDLAAAAPAAAPVPEPGPTYLEGTMPELPSVTGEFGTLEDYTTTDAPAVPTPPSTPAVAPTAPTAPGATNDLGLESMEFVPPSADDRVPSIAEGLERPEYDFDPHVVDGSVPAGEGTPAAFVTETMAELYLQQGFRDQALDVYRQLLAASPGDTNLRERVRQLESGGRTSIASAEVSDDVLRAGQQHHHAGFARRTARSFFGGLAARRVAGRDVGADPYAYGATGVETSALDAARLDTDADADQRASAAPDTGGYEAAAYEVTSYESATYESTGDAATGYESTGYETAGFETAGYEATGYETTGEAIVGEEPPSAADAGHDAGFPEPGAADLAAADPVPPAPTYDEVPDTLAEDTTPDGNLPPALEPSAIAYLAEEAPATEAPAASAPADDYGFAGGDAALAPTPPDVGVTGTVDALFAGEGTTAADEAAAATLAGVYGTAPQGAPTVRPVTTPPAVRPARSELSLDHVFRDTPRQSGTQRRESSAFSFDQFFSDSAGGPATPPSTPAAPSAGQEPNGDIEQFTAWLEGLKKK